MKKSESGKKRGKKQHSDSVYAAGHTGDPFVES